MKTKIVVFLLLMGCFVPSLYGQWGLELLDWGLVYQPAAVDNMPFIVRNVPIHPDDAYMGTATTGPILRTSYEFVKPQFYWGIGVYKNFHSYRFAVRLSCVFSLESQDSSASMQERNYMDYPGTQTKGSGQALTYCRLEEGGIISAGSGLSIAPEVSIERRISNVSIGVSVKSLAIDAINGWDRYAALQQNKSYRLAYCFPITPFVRINIGDGDLMAINTGLSYSTLIPTSMGKITGLHRNEIGFMFTLTVFVDNPQ